jgi:uroporphyrinogen-III synthase
LPTLEIAPLPFSALLSRQLQRLKSAHWAIFISTYAVRHGLQCIQSANADLGGIKVASIGTATSGSLQGFGVAVDLECPQPVGSESLLTTTEMLEVAGQTIVIFRGTGGRELLGRTLGKRGATVEYIECYERRCPQGDLEGLPAAADHAVIVTTSVNGLENLVRMARRGGRGHILDSRLIVIGDRQLAEARAMGWRGQVASARDAGNPAILHRLLEMVNKQPDDRI